MFPRIDKGPIEYHLEIMKAFNIDQQRECIRFRFFSVEEFSHFRYLIAIKHQVEKGKIDFIMQGLKTKGLSMPGTGPAETIIDLFDLQGVFAVTVSKSSLVGNTFILHILPDAIRIVEGIPEDSAFINVRIL